MNWAVLVMDKLFVEMSVAFKEAPLTFTPFKYMMPVFPVPDPILILLVLLAAVPMLISPDVFVG
jgi:hypothetical protein